MVNAEILLEMMEASFDGIWITDGSGKILFVNSANAKLLGVQRSDLEGKTTEELQKEGVFLTSAILDVIKEREQVSRVCQNPRTNLTVLATATPIFDSNGDIQYIFNNVRDITALNQMQDQLQEKDEIIRQQSSKLENMRIKLGVGTIVANSKSFGQVVELAQRAAAFDAATVLILGESGTGKEVISELIVNSSPRRGKPYLQLNCSSIPDTLIESELFGYEKGAFTGADAKGRKGIFEAADGGTVFLDEVGDLPLHMQAKFLRVLQQRRIIRVGGTTPIDLNVRIIAATNRNLKQMVKDGTFREDLYYRLNVVPINIPPLRERKDDILPLAKHFLMVINRKYHTNKAIAPDAISVLESYAWPGNVRELENLIESMVITSLEDTLHGKAFAERLQIASDSNSLREEAPLCTLKETLENAERDAIQQALQACGSIRKAAAVLGVNPSTIVRKQQSYQKKQPAITEE